MLFASLFICLSVHKITLTHRDHCHVLLQRCPLFFTPVVLHHFDLPMQRSISGRQCWLLYYFWAAAPAPMLCGQQHQLLAPAVLHYLDLLLQRSFAQYFNYFSLTLVSIINKHDGLGVPGHMFISNRHKQGVPGQLWCISAQNLTHLDRTVCLVGHFKKS